MTIGVIIQARAGGSRFPGKVFADIGGKPMIQRVVDRVKLAGVPMCVVVATPDKEVADIVKESALVYIGEEQDVLLRYLRAAYKYDIRLLARITADCPLADPEVIDKSMILCTHKSDYASNVLRRTFPAGLDTEVTHFDVLERLSKTAAEPKYREHVTLFVREHPRDFVCTSVELDGADLSNHDWRVDWPDDLDLIRDIYKACGPLATWREIVKYIGGYDAEHLRIFARPGGSAGDHPAAHGADSTATYTESDQFHPGWYEREHRLTSTCGDKADRNLQADESHEKVDDGDFRVPM